MGGRAWLRMSDTARWTGAAIGTARPYGLTARAAGTGTVRVRVRMADTARRTGGRRTGGRRTGTCCGHCYGRAHVAAWRGGRVQVRVTGTVRRTGGRADGHVLQALLWTGSCCSTARGTVRSVERVLGTATGTGTRCRARGGGGRVWRVAARRRGIPVADRWRIGVPRWRRWVASVPVGCGGLPVGTKTPVAVVAHRNKMPFSRR